MVAGHFSAFPCKHTSALASLEVVLWIPSVGQTATLQQALYCTTESSHFY